MDFRSFDRDFARRQRRFDRTWRLMSVVIALVWVAIIVAIGATAYLLLTSTPEQWGAFVGRVVHGFRAASR